MLACIIVLVSRKGPAALLPLLLVALEWSRPVMGHAIDLPPLRPQAPPEFVADVAISLDGEGRPAVAVTVSVPHGELQWLRTKAGYASGAELTVVFDPQSAGRDYGDVWERRVVVGSFEITTSPVAAFVERKVFGVPPGRYELRITVRDVNSEVASSVRERVDVPDYSRVDVGFADLELGRSDSTGRFTVVATRRFGMDVDRLAARVVLFDRRNGPWPRAYPFRYRVLDETGTLLLSGVRELTLAQSADPVVIRPDSIELFLGTYTLEVELVQGHSKWRVERTFEVEESGPPRGREFERILEPLALIAEPDEIEYLRSLAPEQQQGGWEDFWKRRDPSPDSPRNEALLEFFRRLRYVEQRFRNFGPGWRADMGRVYIKYGPPDQIESRPATSQSPQLEVWYYNRPARRFVFADRDGFGRYVLVTPLLE
jgi:GWxTD domain-containing protein